MRRYPLVAALLSALIPGAGQLYARDPYRAAIVFSPTILVLTGMWRFADLGTLGMGELLVQPEFLTRLLVANGLILVWRVAASVDAFVLTSRSAHPHRWAAIGLVAMLAILAVPQMVGWAYGARTISALNAVFVAAPAPVDDPGPLPTEPVYAANLGLVKHPVFSNLPELDPKSTRNMIFRERFGDPDAIAAIGDIYAPTTPVAPFVPFTDRVHDGRMTILLVGGDAGPGREGLRTDSMNVVTIDLATGETAMFGLPRNLKEVPLPNHLKSAFSEEWEKETREVDLTDEDEDGFPDFWEDVDGDEIPDEPEWESCECFPDMLNKVHGKTRNWNGRYPDEVDPGLAALRDIVSNMLDIKIDYYFMVEMAGFVHTIDTIGGVDVYVKVPYHVKVSSPEEGTPKAVINVEPGMNTLSGLEALAYTRWRIGSSDYNRMGRQRCVIKAAATQADTVTLIKTFPKLLELMQEYVTTDIPIALLPDLVQLAGKIDYSSVATVGLVPPTYNSGRTPLKFPTPNVDRMRWKVRDVVENGVVAQSKSGASECDPPEDE